MRFHLRAAALSAWFMLMTTYEFPDSGDEGEEVATDVGSIFSMVGPGGAANPIVAYDFTGYNPALSIAQNLSAANKSGDPTLDLTAQGSARMHYLTFSGSSFTTPSYAFAPFSAGYGALFTGVQNDYVVTAGAPAALRLSAAMSIEWLGYMAVVQGNNEDMHIFDCSASGETEATNTLYGLYFNGSAGNAAGWWYYHEAGAGTQCEKGFFLRGGVASQFEVFQYVPVLLTITRSAAGVVNFYVNGRKSETGGTPAVSLFPTGGTTANLSIGYGAATGRFAILGVRVFNVELTAAQARASYHRTFFGVSL